MVDLKDLLTKFDRVYDNQKGFQYKLKGTFGEEGFFTREEAEERYKKTQGKLIYQKGLEPGQVQTEFEAKKPVIKPLGKPADVKKTKRTELDFFGVETSDRPHLESFGDVTEQVKRVNKIIEEIDQCYTSDHPGKSCNNRNLHELLQEAKKELKKMPELKPDEEIITVEKSEERYRGYLIEYENHTYIPEKPWHAGIWRYETGSDKVTLLTYFWGATKSNVQSLCHNWIDKNGLTKTLNNG